MGIVAVRGGVDDRVAGFTNDGIGRCIGAGELENAAPAYLAGNAGSFGWKRLGGVGLRSDLSVWA